MTSISVSRRRRSPCERASLLIQVVRTGASYIHHHASMTRVLWYYSTNAIDYKLIDDVGSDSVEKERSMKSDWQIDMSQIFFNVTACNVAYSTMFVLTIRDVYGSALCMTTTCRHDIFNISGGLLPFGHYQRHPSKQILCCRQRVDSDF